MQYVTSAENWNGRTESLIPVAPIVSHGVVEEQRLQFTCFQARLTEFRKQLRTESERSKKLAVAEQISTCTMSQTNPRPRSEEVSVRQKEKSRDFLNWVLKIKAAVATAAITFVWQTDTRVWGWAGTNSCYQSKREAVQKETEASRLS